MEAIKLFIKIKNAENKTFETREAIKELNAQIFQTSDQITEAYDNDERSEVLSLCDKSDALKAKRTQLERKIKQTKKEIEQLKKEFNNHRSESMPYIKELLTLASWGY